MEHKGNPPPYSPAYPQLPNQGPPPMGFNPPPQHQTVMVTNTPMVVQPMGPDRQTMTCPSCRSNIVTKMETEATTRTHVIALILCLIGCWPCCCIPYCMDSCQNRNHYCPSCNAFLGTYQS